MGIVYSGRYKRISGVKNFAEIPATVPPLQANETTWLDFPLASSDGVFTGSAVANNRMAVVTTNGATSGARAVSVFVYGIDQFSQPSTLIAEIPSGNINFVRANVEFSPNGRYLVVRNEFANEALNPDQIDVYEVFDDRVEFKRTIDPWNTNIEKIHWFGDSDHYLCRITAPGGYRLYVQSMSKPTMKVQVGSNSAYSAICTINGTNDYIYHDTDGRKVGRLDPVNSTVADLFTMSGEVIQTASATLSYSDIGEGYILKTFDTGLGGGVGRDVYAYTGSSFVRIGSLPTEMKAGTLGVLKLSQAGDIIATGYNSFTKLGFVRLASIGGASINLISDTPIQGATLGTIKAVHYNRTLNRINVIEDSGVRSYAMSNNGFRLPNPPVEPRFFFDLNANTVPTRTLYPLPAQTKTGNPSVQVIDGIPCMQFVLGDSVSQPMLNLMDFGIESGYLHFWMRWEALRANQTFFSFGPYQARPNNDYYSVNSVSIAGVTFGGALGFVHRYKWNHILLAWDRGNVGVYFNGTRDGYTTNATKRPVRDFNNKEIILGNTNGVGNPATSNRIQFRDLMIHGGDTMGLMNTTEPAFVPPKWSQYRNNAAWPSVADGMFVPGSTPIITPKFS